MKARALLLIVAAIGLVAPSHVGARASQAPQQPLFRSVVDSVAVDVSVREGNSVVTTLAASDFRVLDNGVAQDVSTAIYGKVPIDVTVALDVSFSERGAGLARLERGVTALASGLAAADRLRIVAFNEDVHRVIDFTGSQPEIAAALQTMAAAGGTAMFDALATSMIAPTDPGRRQLVMAFTDGADTASTTESGELLETGRRASSTVSMVMPRRVLVASTGSRPATSALGGPFPGGLPAALSPVMAEYVRTLTQLTTLTGGRMIVDPGPPSDLGSSFRSALDAFRSSYVIFFTPRGVDRSGFHTLTVSVPSHTNYTIHARAGYFGS
jgi:VWFA-related protein